MGYYGKITPWKIEIEVLTHTISIPRDLELFAGDFLRSYFKHFNKPKPRGLGLKLSGKRTTNSGWGQSS